MFKIKEKTIHCSRGDAGAIALTIPIVNSDDNYEFQVGDKVKLNIYNKNGYDSEPLKTKEVVVDTASESVTIVLDADDTTFGEIANKPVTYWYDITLNEDQTVVCYNEEGPAEFIQYPAKGDDE